MATTSLRSRLGKLPLVTTLYHRQLAWRNRRREKREFLHDYEKYLSVAGTSNQRFHCERKDWLPILGEKTLQTEFEPHYTYHLAWAARMVAKTMPEKHIDISSSLYFAALVSAFVQIEFYDFRPANIFLSQLESKAGNLMNLPFADASVASLSCMHVIEHVGLGRYGDPIDPDGDIKAIGELKRVVAPGGRLLFVTPIGRPRICFNAHRVYSYRMIISHFADFQLEEFMLLTDESAQKGPTFAATEAECDRQNYGCGCFLFRRPL